MKRLGTTGYGAGSPTIDPNTVLHAVQAEVFPLDVNYFRTEPALSAVVVRLDELWGN
jgi:hypothetical protein